MANTTALKKKLIRGRWSQEEARLLKEWFRSANTRELADQLGRPLTAVRQKAYEMGLKTNVYLKRCWSKDEVLLLKKLFPNRKTRELADQLGHSVGSLERRAFKLRLKKTKKHLESMGRTSEPRKWSDEEVELLRKLYYSRTMREIADQLGRTLPMVTQKARRIGLEKKQLLRWSEDEIEMLKKLYRIRATQNIAELLGRSAQSVRQKAHRIGISKNHFRQTIRLTSDIRVERSELSK